MARIIIVEYLTSLRIKNSHGLATIRNQRMVRLSYEEKFERENPEMRREKILVYS